MWMDNCGSLTQETIKEIISEVYLKGEQDEKALKTTEFIAEIKAKLISIVKEKS
jgi:hypothetical protein